MLSFATDAKGFPVIGVDEAGRGPLAGPVVAAVCFFPDAEAVPSGLNDSKKLTAAQRERLYDQIIQTAVTGVGIASVEEIDTINILQATFLAMRRAVESLSLERLEQKEFWPKEFWIDGNQKCPGLAGQIQTVIKGDGKILQIAAASIVAKVTRDRMMQVLHQDYPAYGWAKNMGYGLASHLQAIADHGITPHHRKTFDPIRTQLRQQEFQYEAAR